MAQTKNNIQHQTVEQNPGNGAASAANPYATPSLDDLTRDQQIQAREVGMRGIDKSVIDVRQPDKLKDFVRVSPHVEHTFELDTIRGPDDRLYVVGPTIYAHLPRHIKRVKFVLCRNQYGQLFFWDTPVFEGDLNPNSLARKESFRLCLLEAQQRWVQIFSKNTGSVWLKDFVVSEADLGEPEWPPKDANALFQRAFFDRYCNDPAHPVVAALKGGRA